MHFEPHQTVTNHIVTHESEYMSQNMVCCYFVSHKQEQGE